MVSKYEQDIDEDDELFNTAYDAMLDMSSERAVDMIVYWLRDQPESTVYNLIHQINEELAL